MECLDSLSPREKEVFLLRDIEEMSIQETAEALGMSPLSVRVRLSLARKSHPGEGQGEIPPSSGGKAMKRNRTRDGVWPPWRISAPAPGARSRTGRRRPGTGPSLELRRKSPRPSAARRAGGCAWPGPALRPSSSSERGRSPPSISSIGLREGAAASPAAGTRAATWRSGPAARRPRMSSP